MQQRQPLTDTAAQEQPARSQHRPGVDGEAGVVPDLLEGPVTVIGAGNGGRAVAAQLGLLGASVRLFNRPDLPETAGLLGDRSETIPHGV